MTSEERLQILRLLTEQTLGRAVRTPYDFNLLILDIQERTGQSISMSTLKRIWRYVNSEHQPSRTILTILANYNGFANLEDVEQNFKMAQEEDSEFFIGKNLMSSSLSAGDEVILSWGNNKGCRLLLLSADYFEVTEAHNIKLREGYRLKCSIFCQGRPFTALNVETPEGISSVYMAALKTGVNTIEVIRKPAN